MNKKNLFIKNTARVTLFTMLYQLISPSLSYALTSGPSQPEVSSFEPVGTTDMVDIFTGDFVYNIPLLDVDGYPVNISYHSGGDMDQEASWVGLGWNINPGVINRSTRGLPDDFNGEEITKQLNIKPEKTVRVGLSAGTELFGVGSPILNLDASLQGNLTVSNYRGVSADLNVNAHAGVNIYGYLSPGVNLGVGIGSQSGADIDYNLSLSANSSKIISADLATGVGINFGHGYNTRSGIKDKSWGISPNIKAAGRYINGPSYSKVVPIGLRSVVPVITNKSNAISFRGQLKLGGELLFNFPYLSVNGQVSTLKYESNGTKKGYGFLYAQNGSINDMQDFTRDKDGMYNKTMNFLPLGNMTYDVYSVSGQGTGGSFRPFRNDFGSIYDPVVSSVSDDKSISVEGGYGNLFEIGTDITTTVTDMTSGPWKEYVRPFTKKEKGSLYENVYFKQAGELTATDPSLYNAINNLAPIKGTETQNIPLKKNDSKQQREVRANLINYFTADEASEYGVASSRYIESYNSNNGFENGYDINKTSIPRKSNLRKGHSISEIVQTQTDGRRYIYGLPAMNKSSEEITFAVDNNGSNDGLITFETGDDVYKTNQNDYKGKDHFFFKTTTPSYAHSFLLTSVLSTDYIDVTGNGPSDDDFGTYTKFNYTLRDSNYVWKTPYGNNVAQVDQGFKSDPQDQKASYLKGTREQWMLHSIETKNSIAEFYVSERNDARGSGSGISHKLDSIKLFNKNDRIINKSKAIPIKTIIFNYDYSLCKGIPNSLVPNQGKLTLKKIFIRYGNSDKSMLSPYQFNYNSDNNYNYNFGNKDRWGMYKPNNASLNNTDFPFVNQDDVNNDKYASAWSLTNIKLPSGGGINIQYEADDYAYVQDKEAMEMFMLQGVGGTKDYIPSNQLYIDKNTPNRFFYFKRNKNKENNNISFRDNYLKNENILYYNVSANLVSNKNLFEPIKGYADVIEVDSCPNNPEYGYIETKAVEITGGGALLNHAAYTGINFSRYYLSHIIFPGNDPDKTSLGNILAGLKYSFGELMAFSKNPVKRMVEEKKVRDINLTSSYIRLTVPGLKKIGGGLRVKELTFNDNWQSLTSNVNTSNIYGKRYRYEISLGNNQTISSGVASYEPAIGGDENPLRRPIEYIGQSGSKWPPHDPIGLYQEGPIGESLFPAPVVGYSRVQVESIHKDYSKSSQGVEIHEFYTAKDFPIKVKHTAKEVIEDNVEYGFKKQSISHKVTQGYTVYLNDMHGKPKKIENRVIKNNNGGSELISYTHYKYFQNGNGLNNIVPIVEYDPTSQKIIKTEKLLGVETDLTIDSREKTEKTRTHTESANINLVMFGIIPAVTPWYYPWTGQYENSFNAAIATKVVQQYGVLSSIESFQEGAITTVQNEAFDPITGQALITSVNNEYQDKEYSVTYPAYWAYKSMGPSYKNIGYEATYPLLEVLNHEAIIPNEGSNFMIGDELFISYEENDIPKSANVWISLAEETQSNITKSMYCATGDCEIIAPVVDTVLLNHNSQFHLLYRCGDRDFTQGGHHYPKDCTFKYVIKPRYKSTFSSQGQIKNVKVKVVRSGAKNQLTESIQSYIGLSTPFENNIMKDTLKNLINISAREYSNAITAILPNYHPSLNITSWDTLNEFVNGTKNIYRLYREFNYLDNRNYNSSLNRDKGTFTAPSYWSFINNPDTCTSIMRYCLSRSIDSGMSTATTPYDRVFAYNDYISPDYTSGYNRFLPNQNHDKKWITRRTITKYSPWGMELENKDATGNFTTAQYGYNEQLPVAVAQNAQQHQILAETFEDYQLLNVKNTLIKFSFSPFKDLFDGFTTISGAANYQLTNKIGINNIQLSNATAHTGMYSLETNTLNNKITIPIKDGNILNNGNIYLPFMFIKNKQYILSLWMKSKSGVAEGSRTYPIPTGYKFKSDIIEGWMQIEMEITAPNNQNNLVLNLPPNAYVDDIRIYPKAANMKAFVYNPINQKLMATLDENNYASFFEYDQEGNLIRTKKETEKGIMTLSESRSAQSKS